MWIGSYKLERNVRPPYYISEKIKSNVESLVDQLKRDLPTRYSLKLEKSWQSESCYLTIRDNKTGKVVKVSFRNHVGDSTKYDYAVYLYEYRTWEECKDNFLKVTSH